MSDGDRDKPFEPRIIQLLRLARYGHPLRGSELNDWLIEIESIVDAWDESEDLKQLRELLGVTRRKGHPRTMRQINREFAMALECLLRSPDDVAAKFHVDPRTVERAFKKHRKVVENIEVEDLILGEE